CRRRRYTVAVSEPFAAEVRVHHGGAPPRESELDGYRIWRWELDDVPGIEWDAWTPPLRDFGPWVDFSTLPTWQPVVRNYMGELLPVNDFAVRQLARDLTQDLTTPREKAAALYRYAARQVRYGRPPHEVYQPMSRPAAVTVSDLRGDCKDKSALLLAMLRV